MPWRAKLFKVCLAMGINFVLIEPDAVIVVFPEFPRQRKRSAAPTRSGSMAATSSNDDIAGPCLLTPNVLSIVGLGIVAQTAEEVSLAKAALSSLAP